MKEVVEAFSLSLAESLGQIVLIAPDNNASLRLKIISLLRSSSSQRFAFNEILQVVGFLATVVKRNCSHGRVKWL